MKTIEFDNEFNEEVLNFLRNNYSKRFGRRWSLGNNTIAVFVHDEYVMRTSSSQSITVVFEPGSRQSTSRVTVIGSGGGEGLFGMDWGSESAAENTLLKKMREITRSRYSSN